jgi:hypothetical protein
MSGRQAADKGLKSLTERYLRGTLFAKHKRPDRLDVNQGQTKPGGSETRPEKWSVDRHAQTR